MPKSDKTTVLKRVNEVVRLLLAGAEFEDIRQYAASQGWKKSNRQLRRYQERAHQRLVESSIQDQQQLMGRHTMQRRALYARALKGNDLRTALQALKDEANLQGLYAKQRAQQQQAATRTSSLSRRDRLKRLLAARARNDRDELALLADASPARQYQFADTQFPETLIYLMALEHAASLLDHAAMVFLALFRILAQDKRAEFWEEMADVHAWRFRLETDAWAVFAKEVGAPPEWLLQDNHRGSFLELFAEHLNGIAPSDEQVLGRIEGWEGAPKKLPTPDQLADDWRELLDRLLKR